MADPISVYPIFVRDQKFPPTGGGGTTLVDRIAVVVKEDKVQVTVKEN